MSKVHILGHVGELYAYVISCDGLIAQNGGSVVVFGTKPGALCELRESGRQGLQEDGSSPTHLHTERETRAHFATRV